MSSSSQVAETWISQFCGLLGHEYFAEVSEDFIEDDFNLTGLPGQVPMYKEALEFILDVEPEEDEEDEEEEEEISDEDDMLGDEGKAYRRTTRHMRMASDASVIESSAELLYGLIHQRYITSRPGIQQMLEKYEMQHFGHCPRVNCNATKVLPVGLSDTPGQETVKLFCPSCLDIYTPPNSRFQTVDGAFFGTTFGCLFFMTFPELDVSAPRPNSGTASATTTTTNPSSTTVGSATLGSTSGKQLPPQPPTINGIATSNFAPGLGACLIYEPRIYGFRVSGRARSGPRMQWLREKPLDITKLDEAERFNEDDDDDDATMIEDEHVDAGASAAANTARKGEAEPTGIDGPLPESTAKAAPAVAVSSLPTSAASKTRSRANGTATSGSPMEMDRVNDDG